MDRYLDDSTFPVCYDDDFCLDFLTLVRSFIWGFTSSQIRKSKVLF